jgi:HD-like signal output (HDOD) protein/ActR/RegA family two-component response regulator
VISLLLVDDDPFILEALADVIGARRPGWSVSRESSTEGVLTRLAKEPVDAVVVDIGLDAEDGATVLERIRRSFPSVLRVVLSGSVEVAARSRAAVAAHRFLSKPCDASRLVAVVEQSLAVRAFVEDRAVCAVLGAIGPLPAVPQVYVALTRALQNPSTSLLTMAAIVEQDVATCAKVLQFANSGFFALGRPITDVKSAISYLGLDLLRGLVLSAGALTAFRPRTGQQFSPTALVEHGLSVAQTAKSLCDGRLPSNDVFVTAMLHDVGKLVLATHLPLHFDKAMSRALATGAPLHTVEREVNGFTHAQLGAYLLGLWGLPPSIVEAVAFHHEPGKLPHDSFHLADAIHAADYVVHQTLVHDDGPSSFAALDLAHLRPSQKPELFTAQGGGVLE